MEDFEKELKLDFLEEATQLLENTEQFFLQLENDPSNPDLLNEIFRFAHNLKGTSRAVGFGVVAEFTHQVESLILKIKDGTIEATGPVVNLLLECNDHIGIMITELQEDFDASFESQKLLSDLEKAIAGEFVEQSIDNTDISLSEEVETHYNEEEVNFSVEESSLIADAFSDQEESAVSLSENSQELDMDALEAMALEANAQRNQQSVPAEVEFDLDALEAMALAGNEERERKADGFEMDLESLEQMALAGNKERAMTQSKDLAFKVGDKKLAEVIELPVQVEKKKNQKNKVKEDESLRVSLSKVESLNNFVGELVILQTVLNQRTYNHITDELSIKTISQLGKLSKEIQEIAMSLRMVPVKNTLQKMNRIVRDTSKSLGKKVNLTLIGEETEIDKTVLEHLSDPLVHIVRNAVDHGLEDNADRLTANKSEAGNIIVEAFHEGNNLIIEVRDDGNGIDHNIIREKAISKGIIRENSNLTNDEVIQLIFHPGFSTKEQVSEVSGRGVGMDVVKTNIEKLSGRVVVNTKMGEGSVFRIELPLTMAIIDGMIVHVNDHKFIIPISQVQESLKPSKNDLHQVDGIGECITIRGDVLPIYRISKLLKIKMKKEKNIEDMITIIVNNRNMKYAVAIDDISHQQQVVIKNLGDEIKDKNGFVGSSILGDGKPSFILDLDELVQPVIGNNLNRVA